MKRTVQDKIEQLIAYLKRDSLDKSSLRDFLKELRLSSEDLLKWSDFDHPAEDSYGRKTIFLGKQFELMVMSWLPGDFSMIHNHGDASWGIVQALGDLTHRVYKLEDLNLSKVKEENLSVRQLVPVTHELIHQMGNATSEPIMSLHFYYNETPTEFITDNTFLFDILKQEIQTVRGGAFYGLPEDEIIEVKIGLGSSISLKEQEELLYKTRMELIS